LQEPPGTEMVFGPGVFEIQILVEKEEKGKKRG
jgi:hypothetical protein